MTKFDDYIRDMPQQVIADVDAEKLLIRSERVPENLEGLAAALETIDLERLELNADHAGHFSFRAAAMVKSSTVEPRMGLWSRLSPKLSAAAVVAILFAGSTGLAASANASVPGDFLYGLDQAMETVGLLDGGIDERLSEAEEIANRGDASGALDHIADSLPEDAGGAADELHRAADRVFVEDGAASDVRTSVTEMLEWMATTDLEGRDFGQGVAERARELGQGPDKDPPGNNNAGPGNNNAGPGNNNAGPGNNNAGGNGNGNAGPGNNNAGPGNNNAGGNGIGAGGPPGGTPPGQSGG